MHTFFDNSGTVFYNAVTGEKMILTILPEQIESILFAPTPDASLQRLFDNGYVEPINN